jgi:Tetracyclin repressor-like, C-terminal domain
VEPREHHPIVERAVEREQLPRGTSAAEVMEHLAEPLYYQLLIAGEPPTEYVADLAAARTGVFISV